MNVDSRTGFVWLAWFGFLLVLLSCAMARAETVTVVTQNPRAYPSVTEQQEAELREAVHATLDAQHGAENISFVTTPRVDVSSAGNGVKLSTLLEPLRAAGKAELLLLPWIVPDDNGFTITVILQAKREKGTPAIVTSSKGQTIRETAIVAIKKAFAIWEGGAPGTEPQSQPTASTSRQATPEPTRTGSATHDVERTLRPSRIAPLILGGLGLGLAGLGVYKLAQDSTCVAETTSGDCASRDSSRSQVGGGLLLGLGGGFVAGAATWMVLIGRTGERATVDVSASLSTLRGRVRF